MAAQTYATLKQSIAVALTAQTGVDLTTYGATFEVQLPLGLSYAENRIFREIPMLGSRETDTSQVTVAGSRLIDLSAMTLPIIVPEQVNLITPAGTTNAALGTRVPFDEATLDLINLFWPVEATTVTPALAYQGGRWWALQDSDLLVLAPTPDAVYTAEVVGLFQPAGLSGSNTSTYLSQVYPELLQAGCLVFLAGALNRNFGAQADEAAMAVSWEGQFTKLLAAAVGEERRRRGLEPDVPRRAAA